MTITIDIADVVGFVDATLKRLLPLSALALLVLLVSPTARQHGDLAILLALGLAAMWAARSDYRGGLD